jgi:hypothetical protein
VALLLRVICSGGRNPRPLFAFCRSGRSWAGQPGDVARNGC